MPFPKAGWPILAALGVLLLLGAACGGGGGSKRLSAEDYFQKVQSIAETATEEENGAFPSEEESANFSPEEQKQAGIDGLKSVASLNQDAIKQIDDLKPPEDLQQAHDALVEEGNSLAQNFRDLADQAENVPPDGIEDFFSTQVFVEATFAPFDEACSALQDLGAGQGIEVNLHCTD
jgi:hypothetical protein